MKFEDMLIVLLIVVILFGGSKIPQLGAGLGKGIRAFKRGLEGKDEEEAAPTVPDRVNKEEEKEPAPRK